MDLDVALLIGSLFAGVAAAIHLYIWLLESVLWSRPATQRTFGVRDADTAEAVHGWAYNQGFYNLFLALGAGTGLVLLWGSDAHESGLTLALFSCLSMLLAAVVLLSSNRRMLRAALIQGLAPLVAVASLGSHLLLG